MFRSPDRHIAPFFALLPDRIPMPDFRPVVLAALTAAVLSSPMAARAAGPAAAAPPTTDKDRTSYAIGQNIGKSLKPASGDLDIDVLKRAIDDVLAGRPSRMTDAEVQTALQAFSAKMQQRQVAESKAQAERNGAAGKAFLAENGAKPGVVTTASGLQYQVLKAGNGPKPAAGATVKVHYVGTLLDGTKFASSYDRGEPVSFPLGSVIRGWTEGLQLMPVGSKYRLWLPPELAYGAQGTPGGPIPPDATLVFDVELLGVQ